MKMVREFEEQAESKVMPVNDEGSGKVCRRVRPAVTA